MDHNLFGQLSCVIQRKCVPKMSCQHRFGMLRLSPTQVAANRKPALVNTFYTHDLLSVRKCTGLHCGCSNESMSKDKRKLELVQGLIHADSFMLSPEMQGLTSCDKAAIVSLRKWYFILARCPGVCRVFRIVLPENCTLLWQKN